MASNRTLSDLPVVTTINGDDIIHTRQGTTDKSVTESKIAEYTMNLSSYSPTVVIVTGASYTISSTIRKQLLICSIATNCTLTFPGTYGNAQEITIINSSGSIANVIGLPNSEILYPDMEITFIWNGSSWVKRKFLNTIITGTTAPTITPNFIGQYFIDTTGDQYYFAIGTSSSNDWLCLSKATQNIITVNANYTITDDIPSGTKFLVYPNSSTQKGKIVITLPTMADNVGKWYDIEFASGFGLVEIDGEGTEKLNFKGNRIETVKLYQAGSHYRVSNNGVDWTLRGSNLFDTNFINNSDWTARKLGFAVTYDNGSGTSTKNTDWTGMVIIEEISGFTAVVSHDSGGAGQTGILYLYNASSDFTYFTNNRKLTASNGQTIDVNETSGSSKNKETIFYHNFNISQDLIKRELIYSDDKTIANTRYLFTFGYNPNVASYISNYYSISNLEAGFYCGLAGVCFSDPSDLGFYPVTTQDAYFKMILDFSC